MHKKQNTMNKTVYNLTHLFLCLFIICTITNAQNPLFPNSVVSNDIDFIRDTDPDSFVSLEFVGREDKEMPSSQSNELFDEDTFVFEATFSDGETIELWCHSSFVTQAAAQEYAEKACPRLGKLPVFQRNMLNHIVIHNGDAGAFAEIQGQFFVLYSDNMDRRISTNDLEETIFHESVHASYQFMFQNDPSWLNAQLSDPAFVTEYGQENPALEDMAESALFAYTFITYPGRLSEDIELWLETNIPNRIEWFRGLYSISTNTDELNTTLDIITYPNPTSEKCTVQLDQLTTEDYIYVYDFATGALITKVKLKEGQNDIDLTDFADGIYILSTKYHGKSMIVKQ